MKPERSMLTRLRNSDWPGDSRAGLLLLFILLMVLREPGLFISPRFWAEEGARYFEFAYHHPWLQALFSPQLGYYSLFSNLAAVLANQLPLVLAPALTTTLAFLVQLLPLSIILFGQNGWWPDLPRKALACLVVLFAGHSQEIWLNTINSQFHLSLACWLILCEAMQGAGRARRVAYGGLLLLAGLTGVVSCFLTPLFWLKAWLERQRIWCIYALILTLCCLVQFAAMLYLLQVDPYVESRLNFLPWRWLVSLASNYPGGALAGEYTLLLFDLPEMLGEDSATWLLALAIFALVLGGYWCYFLRPLEWAERCWFLGGFLLLAVLSTILSLEGYGGARYAYAGIVIMLLLPLRNVFHAKTRRFGLRWWLALLVLMVALSVHTYRYFALSTHYDPGWSRWRDEVALWQAGERETLRIHPQWDGKPWLVRLNNNRFEDMKHGVAVNR